MGKDQAPDRDNNRVPGDARYTAVPGGLGALQSVVARHHGAELKAMAMPNSVAATVSRFAYSYGDPTGWGHPRRITLNRHEAAGWPHGPGGAADLHTTHHTHGLGHIGLGGAPGGPPLPSCGGLCSQRIVQF